MIEVKLDDVWNGCYLKISDYWELDEVDLALYAGGEFKGSVGILVSYLDEVIEALKVARNKILKEDEELDKWARENLPNPAA